MIDIQKDASLKKLTDIAEENNKLLKKMRRTQVTGQTMRILYWLIVIGVGVGAFYTLQPYLENVKKIYVNVTSAQNQLGGFSNFFFGQELPIIDNEDLGPAVKQ